MSQKSLGEFEQVVMLALVKLNGNAYGAAIRSFLHESINRDVALGALYATLERMEKKGLVTSALGESTAQRGGRPKRFFAVTGQGKQALVSAKQAMDKLWQGISIAELGGQHG